MKAKLPRSLFFHGTSQQVAKDLQHGRIDVSKGGGELGRGFYTGDWLWVAKAWADQRHGMSSAVVQLSVPDPDFNSLRTLLFSKKEAQTKRQEIRAAGQTRIFLFGADVIWSPIVGTTRVDADQYKYESTSAESLLNGRTVARKLV